MYVEVGVLKLRPITDESTITYLRNVCFTGDTMGEGPDIVAVYDDCKTQMDQMWI